MKASCFSCLMAVAAMLAGCAQTDRVTFVTASEVGIGADATLGNVNIGYDRNELVIGPVYPETGALPPVYAKLDSDLAIFNPRIQQIYATARRPASSPTPRGLRARSRRCTATVGSWYSARPRIPA